MYFGCYKLIFCSQSATNEIQRFTIYLFL